MAVQDHIDFQIVLHSPSVKCWQRHSCIPKVLIASTTSEGGGAHQALRRLLLAHAGLVGALREALLRGVGIARAQAAAHPAGRAVERRRIAVLGEPLVGACIGRRLRADMRLELNMSQSEVK